MARQTERLPLICHSPGNSRSLLVHRYGAAGARPKAYLQASLHADETPAMLALHHLVRRLDAAEARGEVTGEIVLVPFANPIGLSQAFNGGHAGRYNLDGSGNFNRNWPDLYSGLAERVAGELSGDEARNVTLIRAALAARLDDMAAQSEMASLRLTLARLACDADLLLDVHCDDEALVHLFLIPDHWPQAAPLAAELACHAVLLSEDSGGHSFDETFSIPWTHLAQAFPDHPIPAACLSGTVELRGRADVSDRLAEQDAGALYRSLQRWGYLKGDPGPAPEPLCAATHLSATESLKAPGCGILSYSVVLGERVAKGDLIAHLIDPSVADPAAARSEVRAGTEGLVLSRRANKYVFPGMSVAKIVGTEPLTGRAGGYLLED